MSDAVGHSTYAQDAVTDAVWGRVRQRRAELRWSGEELARRVSAQGVHFRRSMVTNLDNNRRAALSVQELIALAAALGVTVEWLLNGVGQQAPKCRHCRDQPPVGYTCNTCGQWTVRPEPVETPWQRLYLDAQRP